MEGKEMEACLSDIQEVQAGLYQKTERMESLAMESKVNIEMLLRELRATTKGLDGLQVTIGDDEREGKFERMMLKMETAMHLFQHNADNLSSDIKRLPSKISTDVKVRFEGRNKSIFVILAGSIVTASLFLSLWIISLQKNNRLYESDLKYRYLNQHMPNATFKIDTLYKRNPGQFEKTLEAMEYYQKRQQQAENIAKEKEREAKEAQTENDKIKQQGPK